MEKNTQGKEQETLEKSITWVKKDEVPFDATITEASIVDGKYGKDVRLVMETPFGERVMDCFGANKNVLINVYGPRPAEWKGKRVYVEMNEKGHKVLRVVLN